MRHGRHVKKLGVKTAHRHAMLANMANSLISVGRIKTTTARAKEVQSKVEHLITLAKRGDLHARRQATSAIQDSDTVKKLFGEIALEFKNTNGGYTRRAFFGRRLGDGASLSVVELNIEKKVVQEPKKKKGKETAEEKPTTEKTDKKAEKKEAKPKREKKPKAEKKEAKTPKKGGGKKKKAAASK